MKKMLLVAGLLSLQNSNAQTVVDFEDLTVPAADSAWLGSTGEGGFTSHGVYFNNTYTTSQWGDYWSGFIYSNSTDNTTASYTNDYSAYPGVGSNGSPNYAICYGGTIDLMTEKMVASIELTNTTYAALSMLNGDAYGKQFGSPNNAAGDPDGTNGEDWFRVLIIGSDAQGNSTDTVIFYLADYRFANAQQDYILNTWQTVDLSSLGQIRYIDFVLESSDVGSFGMNTPGYFALDNLIVGTLGISNSKELTFKAYPNPVASSVTIESTAGRIRIFSTSGLQIIDQETSGFIQLELGNLVNGSYIVEFSNSQGIGRTTLVKN